MTEPKDPSENEPKPSDPPSPAEPAATAEPSATPSATAGGAATPQPPAAPPPPTPPPTWATPLPTWATPPPPREQSGARVFFGHRATQLVGVGLAGLLIGGGAVALIGHDRHDGRGHHGRPGFEQQFGPHRAAMPGFGRRPGPGGVAPQPAPNQNPAPPSGSATPPPTPTR